MKTRLKVVHTTHYDYLEPAHSSFNEARLSPWAGPEQYVREEELTISPTAWTQGYYDYWGTHVTAFEVHDEHEHLTVTASSIVDVDRVEPEQPGVSWAKVRSEAVADRWVEYLGMSRFVTPPDDLAERAAELAAEHAPREFARAVMDLVHGHVRYVTGSTSVHSLGADAWRDRAGVCQDISHLVIGALRSQGMPARYVSGYLLPDADAAIGQPVVGESHAWVQYWDGAWIQHDPTNAIVPTGLHVEVGHGRDYLDVAPLTGIFTGGGTSGVQVSVEVTRLA